MDIPFFRTEIYVRKQNFFAQILDAVLISDVVQIPNRLKLGQKLIVQELNVFGFQTLTVKRKDYMNIESSQFLAL